MDIKGVFTEKIGPLPAVAWAAGACGIYLVYAYATRDKDSEVTTPAISSEETYSESDYDPFSNSGSGGGAGSGSGSTANDPYTVPDEPDNESWAQQAINWLIASGISGSQAATTLGLYLREQPLNEAQRAQINTVMRQFGAPPEGIITVPNEPYTPTPSSTIPTPPNMNNPTENPNLLSSVKKKVKIQPASQAAPVADRINTPATASKQAVRQAS